MNGDLESLDYIVRFVSFYADHYSEFERHGDKAGQGKVTFQSLDEAVWTLQLLCALNVCGREAFPEELLERWMECLFRPIAELLKPQSLSIHNIPLWNWCAVGAIAIFFEDDALLEEALENEFGIRNQVKYGYTADGFWHECSVLYHYYSTEAFTQFLCFYAEKNPQDELISLLEKTYEMPAALSPDGAQLPAINDGWYPKTIDDSALNLLRANRVIASPAVAAQLDGIYRRDPQRFARADALLFLAEDFAQRAMPERDAARAFPDSCLAVLYQPMHILLKCGVLTTSHMHADCMSISIPPFADDLGTPGYGYPLTVSYYNRTLCHNTFVMDGVSQPQRVVTGQAEAIAGGIRAHADEIYDGVSCTRTLLGKGNAVTDEMVIHAEQAHQFDWIFRVGGECELPAGGQGAEFAGNEASYDQLSDVREYPENTKFALRCRMNGRSLTVRIAPETLEHVALYTAHMPGNPTDHVQTAILLRAHGADICFQARYEIE